VGLSLYSRHAPPSLPSIDQRLFDRGDLSIKFPMEISSIKKSFSEIQRKPLQRRKSFSKSFNEGNPSVNPSTKEILQAILQRRKSFSQLFNEGNPSVNSSTKKILQAILQRRKSFRKSFSKSFNVAILQAILQ
jgi:hypothetical protein